jgi:CheY-like chemotaxis protein
MTQPSPKVLLIGENRHGLIARRTLLEEAGYEVETAKNGAEGIDKFKVMAFDIVVTGYRMPEAGGMRVLAQVREINPRVPVLILSGYVKALGLTAESTGADAVLSKGPSEEQELVRTVGRLLRKKRPRAQQQPSANRKASGPSR